MWHMDDDDNETVMTKMKMMTVMTMMTIMIKITTMTMRTRLKSSPRLANWKKPSVSRRRWRGKDTTVKNASFARKNSPDKSKCSKR